MKIKTKHIICCIKCLFLGLVMALPFIAVLPTALYYGFNEHAINGDKVEYYNTNEVKYADDLIVGNEYYQNEITDIGLVEALLFYNDETGQAKYIEFTATYIETDSYNGQDETTLEATKPNYNISMNMNANGTIKTISYTTIKENDKYRVIANEIGYCNMSYIMTEEIKDLFRYIEQEGVRIGGLVRKCPQEYRTIKNIETNISNQNALEIAFNNVFNSTGFSWVKNSIIATPVYAFVGAFGLTNDLFISNLIVYWTNILLIYAILNIVIVCFTKLTTLGQKKDKD